MAADSAEQKIAVNLPVSLYNSLMKRMQDSGFQNIDDFVTYILHVSIGKDTDEVFSDEDNAAVTKRLKDLGYLG